MKKTKKQLKKEIKQMQIIIGYHEENSSDFFSVMLKAVGKITILKNTIEGITLKNKRLVRKMGNMRNSMDDLAYNLKCESEAGARLKQKLKRVTKDHEKLEQGNRNLRVKLEEVWSADSISHNSKCENEAKIRLKQKNISLEKQLKISRTNNNVSKNLTKPLKKKIASLASERNEANSSIINLKNIIDSLQRKVKGNNENYKTLLLEKDTCINSLNSEKINLLEEVSYKKTQVNELNEIVDSNEDTIDTAHKELNTLKSKIASSRNRTFSILNETKHILNHIEFTETVQKQYVTRKIGDIDRLAQETISELPEGEHV